MFTDQILKLCESHKVKSLYSFGERSQRTTQLTGAVDNRVGGPP